MKQKGRGIGGFSTLFIILIVFAIWYLFGMLGNKQVEITNAEFTKALKDYATTSEIGLKVAEVMRENYFTCRNNREVEDVDDNVRHRVMYFTREVFS